MSLLKAKDISVADGDERLLSPLSIDLVPGEPLIILGETGSGKSLMAQALMGTLPAGLKASGRVAVSGRVLNASDPAGFRGLWGREIGVLPQEPWLSLDPLMRASEQIAESHVLVRGLNRRGATERATSDLAAFDLADAGRRYPHDLSGGMAQRVAIAAARAGGAKIIIADEPTKGLDAARRDSVANLLLSEMGESGGLLVITHDLALARRIGGQVIVLRSGEIVESGATEQVFAAPAQAYTRELIAADPEHWTPRDKGNAGGDPVVSGSGLSLARGGKMLFRDLSISVRQGSVFGVTGPSGCGKSSFGDVLLGLAKPMQGSVRRRAGDAPTAFQKLYQDPVSAFPRRRTLRQSIEDVARLSGRATDVIDALMDRLGLAPKLLDRRPDAVSGGELQRLSLLRVLLMRPSFIFADEPTSRLDPITQARVISLLTGVADQDGVAVMLVSHDRALIRNTADDALQMGEVDENSLQFPEACAASVLQ
ncbi:ABC transporter ATP-binding protein [Amaricoccus tamworthensis]|uniref:ABC transporter ATP-binding protein n=1 Tax=Amaricoccus tamworthensis TaxID=57002 RepID=UPI003C7E285A